MKKYKWIASSDDGSFEDESIQAFTYKRECYNDMRNAALKKMKWNTEFYDVEDNDTLGYKVHFSKNKIIHESYSGVYTYEIKEVEEMKTIELTEECIKMLMQGIDLMQQEMIGKKEEQVKLQTLKNYLEAQV